MSLTLDERARLEDLERRVLELARLIKGAGSKNQMNRLYVLGQKTNNDFEERLETAETKLDELTELARTKQ